MIELPMNASQAQALAMYLQTDPRSYRSFGPYWWAMKAALGRYFDRDALPFLRGYRPDDVDDWFEGEDPAEVLRDAYLHHEQRTFHPGRYATQDVDPTGAAFVIRDPDIEDAAH